MKEYLQKIESFIQNSPFRKMTNFEIEHLDEGEFNGSLDLLPVFKRHDGIAHGGFTAYFADTLMGFAALTLIDHNLYTVFTAEMKISYLNPGLGKRLRGEGSVIKKGKTIHFCEAEIYGTKENGEEYLVCKASGTMCVVEKQKM